MTGALSLGVCFAPPAQVFIRYMDYPKLRPVNIFPVQMSGQNLICLQDPLNISEKSLFIPPSLYFIVSHFDGQHSALDIQTEYMRKFGELLFSEKIQEIIGQLEESLFLEGDRFGEAMKRKEEAFRNSSVREALFAGKNYEGDPEQLHVQMETYFQGPKGPGLVGLKAEEGTLRGVVAPHIDFQRGGPCYAYSHRDIAEKSEPQCFVILGTAHAPMQHPFCLTRKNFLTPLGLLETDKEVVDAIQSKCPYDLFRDEWIHRGEHSIEFQCVFLRFLIPLPTPIRIVPILAGSFHEAIERETSPKEIEPVRQFMEAMRETLAPYGKKVCFIASADLAHLGLQFGDPKGIGEYDLRVLAEEDREMLGYVERVDAEGFFESINKDRDRRRICGLPAIYTMLQTMNAEEGTLLKYDQAFTPETQSVVSFASLAFY